MQSVGLRAALLALCLGAGMVGAFFADWTPAPLPVDAPPGQFSARRAMVDDQIIAAVPHPQGSPAALKARDYIFGRMLALNLHPRRAEGVATEAYARQAGVFAAGGPVENLIGVLPGTAPSAGAILVMAHSDSVPASPGAADDAAGVIAALEMIRALEVAGSHLRSVVVLITDGEEAGLLGARAFFASGDPLLKSIGMVVNMDVRGGGGRVAMFETGSNNGGAIDLFAKAVNQTNALSLMSEVYKYMPNSTDFTVAKRAGYPGYNFAFIGDEFDYHSPSSTPAVLDQGSVQDLGGQVLALVKALVDVKTLPPRRPDAIYTDVLGGPVIAYAPALGWLVILAALGLVVGGAVIGSRNDGERLSLGLALRGLAAALGSPLMVVLVLTLVSRAFDGDGVLFRGLLAEFGLIAAALSAMAIGAGLWVWRVAFTGKGRWTLVIVALLCGLGTVVLGGGAVGIGLGLAAALLAISFNRALPFWGGWIGLAVLFLILTIVFQSLAPPLTIVMAWPLLFTASSMVAASQLKKAGLVAWIGLGVCFALAALGSVELGRLTMTMATGIGLDVPAILAITPLLGAGLVYPFLQGWSFSPIARTATAIVGGLGVAALGFALVRDPFTARFPRPVGAFYLEDGARGTAWRASATSRLDPWSKAAISPGGQRIQTLALEPFFPKLSAAPAPAAPFPSPSLTVQAGMLGQDQRVKITFTPHAGGRELRLFLRPTEPLQDLAADGAPTGLLPRPDRWVQLRWEGSDAPLVISFNAKPAGAMELGYQETIDGLPNGFLSPPKGPREMGWGLSDTTAVTGQIRIKW